MADKTIKELMEEMRAKAGAKEYHGHSYMDLQRFAANSGLLRPVLRSKTAAMRS